MFGDPSWFRPKEWGWGLVPITWQGWAYTFLWVALIVLPFYGLFFSGKVLESFIWMTLASGALVYDVHLILCAMHAPPAAEPVVVAEEPSAAEEPADERKYDFYIQ
jgi:hypothetical protein